MNSRAKGKRGELEISKILREHGYEARRSQQYAGYNGDADIITNIPGYHWEIKRVENLNLDKAMDQSMRDAKEGEVPIVAHRKNGKEWKVTLHLEDFINLLIKSQGQK